MLVTVFVHFCYDEVIPFIIDPIKVEPLVGIVTYRC